MEKVIRLEGRISSSNGAEIEKMIMDQLDDSITKIVFDLEKLEYISSVGLRIILMVKKKYQDVTIINCQPNVYDIFEITGYTSMMEISKGYRKISIEGCEKIGDGFFGTVYRLDPETVVKVYKYPDSLPMIKKEQALSKKAFVMGIPTAIPFDIVKVGDLYGTVFELLERRK